MAKKSFITGRGAIAATTALVASAIGEAFGERYPNYMSVKHHPIQKKQAHETWYHKTFRKPQRSCHTRTKRGRK